MTRPNRRTHLRVGLAQLKPKKAAVETNLAGIRRVMDSHAGAVDVLVYPVAALSGYFLEGRLGRDHRVPARRVLGGAEDERSDLTQ